MASFDHSAPLKSDELNYAKSASVLLKDHTFTFIETTYPSVFVTPGLPFTLAGFMWTFRSYTSGLMAFRYFQALLNTCTLCFLFWIARKLFGEKTARWCAILSILYVPDYYVVNTILTETIFRTFFFGLLLLLISAFEKPTRLSFFFIGVVWGLSCAFRPFLALFPLAVLASWLLQRRPLLLGLRYCYLCVAGFALVMSPWWIRNAITFHKFIPFSAATGLPLLAGSYINNRTDQVYDKYKVMIKTVENDAIAKTEAKARIKRVFNAEPAKYTEWYTIGKTRALWENPFYWRNAFGLSLALVTAFHTFLVVTGFCGLLHSLVFQFRNSSLLSLTLAYYTLMYLPFVCFERYNYPGFGLFILFAALALKLIFTAQPPTHTQQSTVKTN